jgi:hypothetical protein
MSESGSKRSLLFRGGPSRGSDRSGVSTRPDRALRALTPPGSAAAAPESALP